MKSFSSNLGNGSAFTIAEIMTATACLGLVATVMFALLNMGMTLFARNAAVNMAHQQARIGTSRVLRDLHQSVSIPQLANADLTQNATNGPAAGVTFQIVVNGPFQIANDPASSLIQVATTKPNPPPPSAGDHMVVLDYNIESDITNVGAVSGSSNHWNITLANNTEKKIQTKSGSFLVCYITRRVGYVVKNGELRYYPNLIATPTTYAVVSRNLTSATPFSIPLNGTGTPETRYTYVNMTITDPTYTNRAFKGTSMEIVDAHIPYRTQLTKYQ